MLKTRLALAALALGFATTAQAQESDPIIVTGQLPEAEQVRGAVQAVMQERGNDTPLQRYLDPICLHVTGMAAQANAFVRERTLENAREAGIPVGEEGCTANALVFVVEEPEELLALLQERQPWVLTSEHRRRVEYEASEGEPVLVWHNLEPRSPEGARLAHSATVAGAQGTASPLNVTVRMNNQARTRRTGATHSMAVVSGAVVLDTDWLVGMDLERVSDYATMRLLAPGLVPYNHEFAVPTSVTSPFVADEGQDVLTRFDRAYLRALYSLQPNTAANRLPNAVLRAYESEG